jgi:hypothetical protein
MALAHSDRDEVRGAYNSALYLTPRRRMLTDWAKLVTGMIERAVPAETSLGDNRSDKERSLAAT